MTEVTNETVNPEHRKKKLVRKQAEASKLKYYLWLGGHLACVLGGLVTLTWQTLWLKNTYYINSIAYRVSLIGAVSALTATVSHKFGLRYLPPFPTLFVQQNFQYLVLAVVWCFTFKSVFKIIPLFLVSVLQLSLHFNVKLVQNHSEFLLSIIGVDEILLILYLAVRTLFFRNTAGYQLTLVVVFIWLRVLFDSSTANTLAYFVEKLDGKVSNLKNPKVKEGWKKFKIFLKSKTDAGVRD